jgi:aminoglycoside phosphotransferase (APT) family kinase protein
LPKDVYVQPNAPDPVLDNDLVLRLARRHMPDAQSVTAVDESGGEARTYLIDDRLIFKTQRPQQLRPRTSLEKEVFFLKQIEAVLPDLSVPRVLGYGRDSHDVEYTLMTRMRGVALRQAELSGPARLAVMKELGRTLRRVHRMPQAPFIESGLFPGDRSAADVRQRFAEWFEELRARIVDEQRPWSLPLTPAQVAERALAALPDSAVRVALHSNPYHEHTFVDPATGVYIGLIDFGDAYISHPTFDLRRWRTRPEREALLAGYTADEPVDEAFPRTWLVAQVLGDLGAIASNPAAAEAASEDLRRLVGEL